MVAYRNAAAVQEVNEIDWGDGVVSAVDAPAIGRSRIDRFLSGLCERLEADSMEICLSSDHTFRQELNTGYKTNRDDKPRPPLLAEFKEYLVTQHGAERIPLLEADDVMGIRATDPSNLSRDRECVVVTIDKDLKQIPGLRYNPFPSKSEPQIEAITQNAADDYFFFQTLTGDDIDGYIGCRGIGPVKARKVLDSGKKFAFESDQSLCRGMWCAVVSAYESKGFTEADALAQARMARILRFEDWSPTTGVKLWTPPS